MEQHGQKEEPGASRDQEGQCDWNVVGGASRRPGVRSHRARSPGEERGLYWERKRNKQRFLPKGILGEQDWEWDPEVPNFNLHSQITELLTLIP